MSDTKHGWVTPRADGARARCGGPGVCATCDTEAMHEKMLAGVFGAQDDAKDVPPAMFGDEAHVSIPIGLIGAACSAMEKKRDAPKTLAELRRYTFGDLSRPAPAAGDARDRAEMFRLERDHERAKNERLLAILVGITHLTLPSPITVGDKQYVFTPPEAVAQLRNLSDRIRAIHAEIDAVLSASQQQEVAP